MIRTTSISCASLLCACVMLSSCVVYRVPSTVVTKTYSPSVTLKTGQTITGEKVIERTPFIGRDKIQIDDTKYLAKDVAFYQTRSTRFANVGGAQFATQTMEGKINMYTFRQEYTTTSYSSGMNGMGGGMHTSRHVSITNYLQKGGEEAKLELFSRDKVRQFVMPYKPSLALMAKSDKDIHTARIIGLAGGGVALTGLALVIAGGSKVVKSDNGSNQGTGAFLAGFGLLITSPFVLIPVSIFRAKAQRHAFEAIQKYNLGN